jgi:hypothetical protein
MDRDLGVVGQTKATLRAINVSSGFIGRTAG